jgi:predicted amidophosphoribosyltransferase
LLCPNCHSQTDNYCGSANSNPTKYYCKDCGKEITRNATYCPVCSAKHSRKVERPSLEQLINDFKELKAYTKIGKKYGVKDNSIKKWFISYGLPGKVGELKEYIKSNY